MDEDRLDDATEIILKKDLRITLTAGTKEEKAGPGEIVLPVERLIPKMARGLVIYALGALYFTVLTSLFGATLGKRLTGIRVRSLEGEHVSLVESFERYIGYVHIPALLCWPVVYLWTDPNRQLPHDRAARTAVLRVARRLATARTPPRSGNRRSVSTEETPSQEASPPSS